MNSRKNRSGQSLESKKKDIRRKNLQIKKRNRNRVIIFSILVFFAIIGVISLIGKLPFFKAKDAETLNDRNAYMVGGDAEHQNQDPSADEIRELYKGMNKESFTDKLQGILLTNEEVGVYASNEEASGVIGTIEADTYVSFYGSEDGWFKVASPEYKGFAKAEYFEEIDEENVFKIVDGILVVNKKYRLPEDFAPGMDPNALQSFSLMKGDMERDNMRLDIVSDYRNFEEQKAIYENDLKNEGKAYVDEYTAEPGHSEHQAGLAIDVTNDGSTKVNLDFAQTKEYEWLSKNAYKYGFIIRYPKNKEEFTGYKFEPWHLRYLGADLAKKVYDSGLTLEEYYELDAK